MIRRCFGNALHWYQALTVMAKHEVDTWIRNATSATNHPLSRISPTAGGTEDVKEEVPTQLQGVTVEEIEDEGDVSWSPPPHSAIDMAGSQPLPFPMPRDYPHANESIPNASSPSVYLQRRCPICFSGSRPNLKTSACVPTITTVHEY